MNDPELAHFEGRVLYPCNKIGTDFKRRASTKGYELRMPICGILIRASCEPGHLWHKPGHLVVSLNQCPRHPLSLGRNAVGRSTSRG